MLEQNRILVQTLIWRHTVHAEMWSMDTNKTFLRESCVVDGKRLLV